jgi:hypothetical protein
MAVITLILAVLGVLLIVSGTWISIADWEAKQAAARARVARSEAVTETTGLPDAIDALTKFAEALKGYPLGMQLIMVGVLLEVIAAFLGGVGLSVGK